MFLFISTEYINETIQPNKGTCKPAQTKQLSSQHCRILICSSQPYDQRQGMESMWNGDVLFAHIFSHVGILI